jgi:hypothetical protein
MDQEDQEENDSNLDDINYKVTNRHNVTSNREMVEIRNSKLELLKLQQEDRNDYRLAQSILNNIHEQNKYSKSQEEKEQENEVNQIISIIENEEYNYSCIYLTKKILLIFVSVVCIYHQLMNY